MPCTKCSSDFNLLNWKIRCFECEDYFCTKCLKKVEGDLCCEICEVMVKRPPNRTKLMELKPKDLQAYLNRHNISTHGIVEKQELVELFYKTNIPVRHKKCTRKFATAFSGSVPNLAARSQTYINSIRSLGNAEAAFNSRNWPSGQSANNSPHRSPQTPPERPPPPVNVAPSPTANTSVVTEPSAANSTNESPTTSTNRSHSKAPAAEPSPHQPRKFLKLSDFENASDLNDLSVKQLKELLTLNRVDYKGCVEKAELLERANRLWNDTNLRKADVSENSDNLDEFCKICMDAPLDCVLLECGHLATCIDCGKKLAECPICRQYVTRVVRTFKA